MVSDTLSSKEPYVLIHQPSESRWVLAVNTAHPMCDFADGDSATHLVHLIADTVALWMAHRRGGEMNATEWTVLKDAVLRSISEDE